jgi:hypothetical protein
MYHMLAFNSGLVAGLKCRLQATQKPPSAASICKLKTFSVFQRRQGCPVGYALLWARNARQGFLLRAGASLMLSAACDRGDTQWPFGAVHHAALTQQPRNPMKKTDLYKNEGLKINGQMRRAGTPDRFGSAAGAAVSRRDQRKLEQAQGLVAFAVKLDGELVKQIHARAESRQTGINETVADLLVKGLAA